MTLGIKDKRVLKAFVEGKPAVGHKLSTDGQRLDGHWLGGSNIAHWIDAKDAPHHRGGAGHLIQFHDLGSKSAQSIQRALRKLVPSNWITSYWG